MATKTTNFDAISYIENAFLDRNPQPTDVDHHSGKNGALEDGQSATHLESDSENTPRKFRKTEMSAPRPRKSHKSVKNKPKTLFNDPSMQVLWDSLPKNLEFLFSFYDDSVTANYYRGEFKESRLELAQRLIDPELSLEETSRLLGVCPATVRRYTNRGWIQHHRTQGGQRRFRLSNLVKFVELHGRFPEE